MVLMEFYSFCLSLIFCMKQRNFCYIMPYAS